MLNTSRRVFRHALRCFCVAALTCCAFSINAQTDWTAQLNAFVLKAYNAYQQKDLQTLLSLHSESSPYYAEFREMISRDFAHRQNVRSERKLIRAIKADVQANKATLRLVVNMDFRDIETGREAEGFPEWDHTLYLVKEQGAWKLWRFTDTAEEFAGLYLKATTDDERASIIAKARPATSGFLKGLEEVGRALLEDNGDDVHAAEILHLEYRLAAEIKNMWGEGGALVGLGDVYFAEGDYVHAAENYQQVLTLAEKAGVKEGIAAVSAKMGNLHYAEGNFAEAMEYYLKSVRLYEELGSRLEITYPHANLGNAYFALGDHEKALAQYQTVLKIYEQLSSRSGAAWLRNQIADVYAAQGKNELARAFYSLSLKAHEELGNKPAQANSLNGIGRICLAEGKYVEAVALFARAAALARASHAPEILWKALNLLGQSHRALRENGPARRAFADSIAVIELLRTQFAGTERDQELSFESKTTPFLEMVELLIEQKQFAEAFVYAERVKGRMLLDVLRNGRVDITKNMSAEEREREQTLPARLTTLNSQMRRETASAEPNQTRIDMLGTQIQTARLEYDAYETRIYSAHPDLKVERGEAEPLSLNQVATLIGDQQIALLEYVVTRNRTYVFVLTKPADTVRLNVYPIEISAWDLAKRVADFRQRLAGNSADFKELARDLYDLLLQPVQTELEGKTAICIVPSEGLWELPFQALLSRSNKYVLEDHALSYVPSLSVLREMKKKARAQRVTRLKASSDGLLTKVSATASPALPRLLAIGNPSLSGRSVSRLRSTRREVSFDSLPQAEHEVKAIGEIYGAQESTILIGNSAREETFKATASKYPVLHFAAHGVLDNVNPLYSRLLLATESESEDGFLEAREIMKLDLHADLAVLSACQTARGQIGSGEGLIGMSWALFIAGTSTTVASQWKVDSVSTARMMIDFHRNLQSERGSSQASAAEALRRAAINLMADPKYRHPFFWSGFVVVGNGI
jgi:CHAT domain-containing protein/tetratricopeptide (TPR) repeat protein